MMHCTFCGKPARLIIGPQTKEEQCIAVCDIHYYLLEEYLQPQPCCLCGKMTDATHILAGREGDERICGDCHERLKPEKYVILRCQTCGNTYGLLRALSIFMWLERNEKEAGWASRDYVGMALQRKGILVDIAACPHCEPSGTFYFPLYEGEEEVEETPCDLQRCFQEIMKHFTGHGGDTCHDCDDCGHCHRDAH